MLAGEIGCQRGVHQAAVFLSAAARQFVHRCIALGTTCLDAPGGRDECCAAAAPRCGRSLAALDAARSTFANEARRACRGVPLRRLMNPMGLGFAAMQHGCDRLDPPIRVKNKQTFAECLSRILVEDVAHEIALVEQPRALEALSCLDVAAEVPGVLREEPATCFPEGGAPPAPTPTAAMPTPSDSGPTPSGGAGTPTASPPGSATPIPTATPPPAGSCTSVEVTLTTSYAATDIAGIQATVRYPSSASIPGALNDTSVLAAIENLSGVDGLLSASDQDLDPNDANNPSWVPFVTFGLVTLPQTVPAGPLARIRFACTGSGPVTASQFSCMVTIANTSFQETETPCSLAVSVIP
jgi:hypothetical protein